MANNTKIPTDFKEGGDDELLCTKELAKRLSVSTQWLEIGRVHGYGPPFIKMSPRMVRYRISDVRKWLNARSRTSTSQEGQND